MAIVFPQPAALRPLQGPAALRKEEILSLSVIKRLLEQAGDGLASEDGAVPPTPALPKHARRFQALAKAAPAKSSNRFCRCGRGLGLDTLHAAGSHLKIATTPGVLDANTHSGPCLHLALAGHGLADPALPPPVLSMPSVNGHPAEAGAPPATPVLSMPPTADVPAAGTPAVVSPPALVLTKPTVVASQYFKEAPRPALVVERTSPVRKMERRGVPPPLQERRQQAIYDW